MTPTEEDFEERASIVAEGNRIGQAEATRLVRSWWEQASRLDFTDQGSAKTHGSKVWIPGAKRVIGTRNGRA